MYLNIGSSVYRGGGGGGGLGLGLRGGGGGGGWGGGGRGHIGPSVRPEIHIHSVISIVLDGFFQYHERACRA